MILDQPSLAETIIIKPLKQWDYLLALQTMKAFTLERTAETVDELWLVEHPPVFTLGQNTKKEHILHPGNIPIIQADRGGQVTYHGPGQLMIYTLIDINRKNLGIRAFVTALEQSIIDLLALFQVNAYAKKEAPGVYVKTEQGIEVKLCSIGLRVRRGYAYHGLALNVDMDLTPFSGINPCGYKGLTMTMLSTLTPINTIQEAITHWIPCFLENLRYTRPTHINDGECRR